jgi:translation initiation factor 1
VADCTCKKAPPPSKGDGIIRISLQTKGRKGKKVTMLTGFIISGEDLGKLATELKRKCGAGGSVEGNTVEIQGDFRQKITAELTGAGFKVKQVGG